MDLALFGLSAFKHESSWAFMGSHGQKCKKIICSLFNMGMFHFPENAHSMKLLNKPRLIVQDLMVEGT